MLILGIDTSGRQGSVALLKANGEELVTLELAILSGGQYSELLVPTVAELLVRHGFERSAIGLIAVASGPGSFTGLRIAIATVKGLSEAFATPVVAVSMLEAVAQASGVEGETIAALDAQRSEVFFGEYRINPAHPEAAQLHREKLSSFENFTAVRSAGNTQHNAQDNTQHQVFTPDEKLALRLRDAGFDARLLSRPSAEAIARIAHCKFLAGVREDVAALDANYLRRSDAEIFAKPA